MTLDPTSDDDPSRGWDEAAARFMAARSRAGVDVVLEWARALPPGAAILDLGCGSGTPIAEALVNAGFEVHGIDASPALIAHFRRRLPHAPVACEPVETSTFFGRAFDGIIAIGLLFLLPPETQRAIIRRVASALTPAGRFLFTAPTRAATWPDALTGRPSVSLGDAGYRDALADGGLEVTAEYADEGENHYYEARRISRDGTPIVRQPMRTAVVVRNARTGDDRAIWRILEPVIRGGDTYALPSDMTERDALQYWLAPGHEVFVAESGGDVVGTYYMRPNQRGGGAHVANCGYVTAVWAAGRGVARTMCAHSLDHARSRGYLAMQFNFVVSTNERAVRLWQDHGFLIVGRLPRAFRHPSLGYVDALVMHRFL